MTAKFLPIPDLCIRPYGGTCQRCQIACPAHAISFESETATPVIDHDVCTQCGICMGICDGFSSTRVTLADLHERLSRIAMRGQIVYITCKENILPDFEPAENVCVVPCMALIPPEMWALLLAENIPVCIVCDLHYCEDCNIAPKLGEPLFSRSIEMAESWTGGNVRWDHQIPEKRTVEHIVTDETGYSRRDTFDNLKNDVLDVATGKRRLRHSEVLQDFYQRRERSRARQRLNINGNAVEKITPQGLTRTIMMPRHNMILQAAKQKPESAKSMPLVIAHIDHHACNNCFDCVSHCITGALRNSSDGTVLEIDPRLCIGCEACIPQCKKAAISLIQTTAMDVLITGSIFDEDHEGTAK